MDRVSTLTLNLFCLMIYDASLPMSPEAEARWAAILEWAERELDELGPGEARQIMARVGQETGDRGQGTGDRRQGTGDRARRYAWQERADLCG